METNPDQQLFDQPDKLTERQASKGTIIVAADDPDMRKILEIILVHSGYQVHIKENGSDLIKNDFEIPDLFMIDRQLPGYNGVDICQHLKNRPQTKNISIIMISGSKDMARLSRTAGADSYIEKPFAVSYLLKIVNYYIHLKHLRQPITVR